MTEFAGLEETGKSQKNWLGELKRYKSQGVMHSFLEKLLIKFPADGAD